MAAPSISPRNTRQPLWTRGNLPRFEVLFFFLLISWLVFSWFQTVEIILRYYTAIPASDYWRIPQDLVRYKTLGLRVFWIQHNEHRILCQEIVFFIDSLLLRGRQVLPIAVSFLCWIGTWLVLAWTVFADKHLPRQVRLTAALLAGIVIGWKGSAAVLAVPFDLAWLFVQFSLVLAFVYLTRARSTNSNRSLAIAILSAFIATYSLINGLLVWPLLLAAGLLLKLDRRKLLAVAIAAVCAIGLYFYGYQFTGSLHIRNLFLHPFYTLEFIASYLSMPFGGMKGPSFGVCIGLAMLAIGILLAVVAARNRLLASRQGIVFFGYFLFTLLTAILTAAGRMNPGEPTFADAKPMRYVTVPLLNWAVFLLICFWVSSRRRWKIFSPPPIAVACIVLLAVGFLKLKAWQQRAAEDFATQQLVALSVEDGLRDRMLLRKIFPQPEFTFDLLDYFREHRMSIFASHRYQWVGQPADKFSQPIPETAIGHVSYVFPVLGGLEVVGWLDTSGQHLQPQWILLTNEKRQIVGFGRKLPAGFPSYLNAPDVPYSLAWAGFVDLQIRSQTYSAYVVTKAGFLRIQGSFSPPSVSSAARKDLGPVLSGIQWQTGSGWALSAALTPLRFDTPPPGRIYSSLSGTTPTGRIVSSTFAAPANGCLILPVLHGPSIVGQSVDILDADTGSVLMHAPMQNEDVQWEFWRWSVPSSVKHLRISASDEDAGAWTAISDPTECP